MKRKIRLTGFFVLVVILLLLMVSPALATPNPFIGRWYNTDFDGSHQSMTIGAGPIRHRMVYFDDGATACSPDGGITLYPARLLGWGTIDGNFLNASLDMYCLAGPMKGFWGSLNLQYVFDPASNTLTAPSGVVWHR